MCVTVHDASLGRTTEAGWRYPAHRTHCLAYANEPASRRGVPNAMILHIPVAPGAALDKDSFVSAFGLRRFLDDMWQAAPKRPGDETVRVLGIRKTRGEVSVFTVGSYTWVTARQASPDDITAALDTVPEDRRPQIGPGLLGWYQRTWPDDALAIGCFATDSGNATEPVVIEYEPQDWDVLRMPATDAHGMVPSWDDRVPVNHRVIVGTEEFGIGGRVRYAERLAMSSRLRDLLPLLVVGAELSGFRMPNGDFYADFRDFARYRGEDARTGHFRRAHGPVLNDQADRVPVLLG